MALLLGLLRGLVALSVVLATAWAGLGIWFRSDLPGWARGAMVAAGALVALRAATAAASRRHPARTRRGFAFVVMAALFTVWWTSIRPSNDRDWMADVARLPGVRIAGEILTIENLRNFDYRSETDFSERWETRSYDLAKLRGASLFLSHWGSPAIAHTIVSWEFDDGPPLAISIETRKEETESYSTVRGFFREYELYYVVADERDLIRLRTNYRGEQVFLYRVRMPIVTARALLFDYLEEVNRLRTQPRWYNAATHNCTTAIRKHVQHVTAGNPFDWRILVNGYLDELMYERRTIDTTLPFADLKARSDITERAKAADSDPKFSERIRDGIPSW